MSGKRPRIIAHRGFAGIAPENTLGAFQAVADGRHAADGIEFDVMPSADGDVVVFHDHRLDARGPGGSRGITNGNGIVWETATETIHETEVLNSGETIPLLDELLDVVPPDLLLNVELRNPGSFGIRFGEALDRSEIEKHRERWEPFVERVVTTLDGCPNEVLFSSFTEGAIAAAREYAPERPTAVICYDSIADGLTIVDRYECEAIHPRRNMIKGTPFFERSEGGVVDPDFGDHDVLAAAADRGISVNVWTLTTWYEARVFTDAGVDGLITDYPDLSAFGGRSAV